MGYVSTPTFRVEVKVDGPVYWTPAAWRTKYNGRPTDASLARYVTDVEASTRPGGANEHLGETRILSARVVRQSTDEVVARFDRVDDVLDSIVGIVREAQEANR